MERGKVWLLLGWQHVGGEKQNVLPHCAGGNGDVGTGDLGSPGGWSTDKKQVVI